MHKRKTGSTSVNLVRDSNMFNCADCVSIFLLSFVSFNLLFSKYFNCRKSVTFHKHVYMKYQMSKPHLYNQYRVSCTAFTQSDHFRAWEEIGLFRIERLPIITRSVISKHKKSEEYCTKSSPTRRLYSRF